MKNNKLRGKEKVANIKLDFIFHQQFDEGAKMCICDILIVVIAN